MQYAILFYECLPVGIVGLVRKETSMEATSSTIQERLRLVVKHAGINQAEFARSVEIGQPHLSTILSDKHKRKPSKRLLRSISDKYNVNYDWLTTGEGKAFFEPEVAPQQAPESTDPPELQQVISEARTIWEELAIEERYEMAAMLLRDLAQKKKKHR